MNRPASPRSPFSVARITADVAQAVVNLQAALLAVDAADEVVAGALTGTEAALAKRRREEVRATLRRVRAELDTVLLGPDQ